MGLNCIFGHIETYVYFIYCQVLMRVGHLSIQNFRVKTNKKLKLRPYLSNIPLLPFLPHFEEMFLYVKMLKYKNIDNGFLIIVFIINNNVSSVYIVLYK